MLNRAQHFQKSILLLLGAFAFIGALSIRLAAAGVPDDLSPDITVAADGSADFTTIQAAVASIPSDNHERKVILIKPGVYNEKVRIDAPCVTLRGADRKTTRVEFSQLMDDFTAKPDDLGRAVINIRSPDVILENLSVANTAGVIGKHAFAIYGDRDVDRTVILDTDASSEGNDTVSLWNGKTGRYYHANCNFRGSVDFVCPRGWCYLTDCNFYEVKPTAAVWHDGRQGQDMKYVLHNCHFDGVDGWNLARHHVDAQFYFLDCTFAQTMADKPIRRVIYPLGKGLATDADTKRNADLDKQNQWGERAYFYNCHRDGGDFDWFQNNLDQAPGSPKPDQITAAWTFADTWNPVRTTGPVIKKIAPRDDGLAVTFSESVTVKGHPQLKTRSGEIGDYSSGSGTDTLVFKLPEGAAKTSADIASINLNSGKIIASEATVKTLNADLSVPK